MAQSAARNRIYRFSEPLRWLKRGHQPSRSIPSLSPDSYIPALRFSALTRFYDPVINLTTREQLFRSRLIAQLSPAPADTILDLGCGSGTLALKIQQSEPDAEVIGLDADPEILAIARTKAADNGQAIRFDRGFSNQLPYADATFDAVVSTLFFHHLMPETRRETATEIARVLRPGGELHVADWGLPSDRLMKLLSTSIRLLDGGEPTRENFSGALPSIFEAAGLVSGVETGQIRTVFGTLALYRAIRPREAPHGEGKPTEQESGVEG